MPSDDTRPIFVLLVDDHAVVRRGLRTFFDLTDDIRVVGEARMARSPSARHGVSSRT